MSIFSTGLSGLNAAQSALNSTSNNISNVYTPGYNREVTQLGEGRAGGGVQVNDIQRQFNQYVASQLNAATSKSSALEAYNQQVEQVDSLLADRDAGLAPLMQNFFSAMEDLASAPSDPAARQGVLGAADTLTAQFRSFDGYLQDMQEGINGQIADEVTQINNATEQLADINREIALARARSGEAPNSLLNQRDHMVHELNERMDVRLNIQDGKTYNISLPNGQPLVAGTQSYKLEVVTAEDDAQRKVLGYIDGAGNSVPLDEDVVTGGALGGLMDFRAETLDKTQNQVGQLAVSLAVAFNQQHANGVDLDGEQGGAFFEIGQPRAYAEEGNAGSAQVTEARFDVDNIARLKATDYSVRVTNATATPPTFEVTRQDSGKLLDSDEVMFDTANGKLSFGGVTLTLEPATGLQDNDRFEVQPVRRAGSGMETSIADLDKIAAGSFEIEQSKVGASDKMDVGNVSVVGGNAFSKTTGSLGLELHANGKLTITEFIGTTVLVNGEERNLTNGVVQDDTGTVPAELSPDDEIIIDGVSFTLGALPEPGKASKLNLSQADASSGDNRNALALQNMQAESIVGGSSTVSDAYGAMVSDVGNRTNIVHANLDAQQGLTKQLEAVQQSESGVNLDEEAANLIRYQQFYQANARVIDTGTTILDTILGLRN